MIVGSDTTPLISLMKTYQSGNITADEIRKCIEILRDSGRYIGENFLKMLYEQIQD